MNIKTYQYGSSPEHRVRLTENQARAVNEFVFFPDESIAETKHEGYTSVYGTARLPDGITMNDYDSAAVILNEYIRKNGKGIPCSEEYLMTHPILTLIED